MFEFHLGMDVRIDNICTATVPTTLPEEQRTRVGLLLFGAFWHYLISSLDLFSKNICNFATKS